MNHNYGIITPISLNNKLKIFMSFHNIRFFLFYISKSHLHNTAIVSISKAHSVEKLAWLLVPYCIILGLSLPRNKILVLKKKKNLSRRRRGQYDPTRPYPSEDWRGLKWTEEWKQTRTIGLRNGQRLGRIWSTTSDGGVVTWLLSASSASPSRS